MKVPTSPQPANGSNLRHLPPKIDPTILAMTAAMMHQEGRFFHPPQQTPDEGEPTK